MRFKQFEPVNPEVLYERSLFFENLNFEELRDLLSGVRVALDIVHRELRKRKFSYAKYGLVFSSCQESDSNYLAVPLTGSIYLCDENERLVGLNGFRRSYVNRLRDVWTGFGEGSDMNLEASVIGYLDVITKVVDSKLD